MKVIDKVLFSIIGIMVLICAFIALCGINPDVAVFTKMIVNSFR